MKKIFAALSIMAVAMMGVVATPDEGSAVPTFARQTGNPCWACHHQHIPKLNAYGRAFKLGGYTDASVDLIEDDMLSTPATMPISFITKIRYQMDTPRNSSGEDAGTDRGEWQIPDEAALFLGGRVNANAGYLVEWAGGWGAGKVVLVGGEDVKYGLSIYQGSAPSFGQELFNTGWFTATRSIEQRKAPSHTSGADGSALGAQGLTFYAGSGSFFAAVGLWAPVSGHADGALDLSTYYRLALTGEVAGGDGMVGVFGTAGETKCVECAEVGPNATASLQTFKTETFGVDAQWQAEGLEVLASYSSTGSSHALATESNGFSVSVDYSLNPAIVLKAAYDSYTDKSGSSDIDTTATTVGVLYNMSQNLTFRVETSFMGGDGRSKDQRTTVMLFGGF